MSRTCTICSHPQRDAIDQAIVTGMANRPIASNFRSGTKRWNATLPVTSSKPSNSLALSAVDRVMKQLELQAKLLGDLDDAPTVNVWLPAPWAEIEAAILSSLTSYPEARVAVASALMQLEEGGRAKLN